MPWQLHFPWFQAVLDIATPVTKHLELIEGFKPPHDQTTEKGVARERGTFQAIHIHESGSELPFPPPIIKFIPITRVHM